MTASFLSPSLWAAAWVSVKKLGSKIDIEHRFFTPFYLRYDCINRVLVASRTQIHDCFYSSCFLLSRKTSVFAYFSKTTNPFIRIIFHQSKPVSPLLTNCSPKQCQILSLWRFGNLTCRFVSVVKIIQIYFMIMRILCHISGELQLNKS